jgi:hypothetical protein
MSVLWCCSVSIGLIRIGVLAITKNIYYAAEPPWGSKVTWQIINRDLDYLIRRHYNALKNAVLMARDIDARLDSICPLLDELCRVTCPWCPNPCCLSAEVWIDFKDLLFLHLGGHPIPDRQLRSNSKKVCRCLRPKGCVLPRMSRPWICTWYLCPTQKAILRRKSQYAQDKFSRQIQAVKDCRRKMEAEFIRIVS